jgi:hypothetical protein
MQKKNIIISFIAGFLIGICGTVLTINIVNMHQRSLPGSLPGSFPGKLPDTAASLKKTDVLRELQQTRPPVDNLTAAKTAAPGEGVRTDDKVSAAPKGKEAAVPKSQDEIALNGIKVYIQYAREKDKKIAEAFSAELRTKGYAYVDVENIKHRHRDIRYFHGEDKKAALLLRKQFNNFIAGSAYAKKVSLKIRYLGKIYPKAQKGSLELWVFF